MKPHELLAALMREAGLGSLPLAKAIGKPTLQPAIHRFASGQTKQPDRSTTEPLAKFFKIPIDALYSEEIATKISAARGLRVTSSREASTERLFSTKEQQPVFSEAHGLSDSSINTPLTTKKWGEIEMQTELDEVFEVALNDDAMAPDFPAGMVVKFRRAAEARFGNRVLIRDGKGKLHFRELAQSADDQWEAIATRRGFLSFKPRSGARIVAIKTGHYVEGA